METAEERLIKAREIYDHHIMVEMLAHSHVSFHNFIVIKILRVNIAKIHM